MHDLARLGLAAVLATSLVTATGGAAHATSQHSNTSLSKSPESRTKKRSTDPQRRKDSDEGWYSPADIPAGLESLSPENEQALRKLLPPRHVSIFQFNAQLESNKQVLVERLRSTYAPGTKVTMAAFVRGTHGPHAYEASNIDGHIEFTQAGAHRGKARNYREGTPEFQTWWRNVSDQVWISLPSIAHAGTIPRNKVNSFPAWAGVLQDVWAQIPPLDREHIAARVAAGAAALNGREWKQEDGRPAAAPALADLPGAGTWKELGEKLQRTPDNTVAHVRHVATLEEPGRRGKPIQDTRSYLAVNLYGQVFFFDVERGTWTDPFLARTIHGRSKLNTRDVFYYQQVT